MEASLLNAGLTVQSRSYGMQVEYGFSSRVWSLGRKARSAWCGFGSCG